MRAWSVRSLARLVVAAAVAGSVLGLFPPVFGESAPPPTVIREARLAVADLVAPSATAARIPGGVRVEEPAWTRPATACAPITFTAMALTWQQGGTEPVRARVSWGQRGSLEGSARLVADDAEGPDPGSPDDSGIVGTPLQWTGEARCMRARLRLPAGRFEDLRAVFINTSGSAAGTSPLAWVGGALARVWGMAPGSTEQAAAMTVKPHVITRKQWGANESWRKLYCDGQPDYAPRLKMAYVHHTAGSNDYSMSEADDVVRAIYAYHVKSRHYCDIAYNFLIDRFGRIYEGRYGGMARPVIGAHAMGFNTGSTGISAMGDFTSVTPPAVVRTAYKKLLAWRLDVAHLPPKGWTTMVSSGGSTTKYDEGQHVHLRIISGHRDTGYTSCPGNKLYQRLPRIRYRANQIGSPKIWRPRQTKPTIAGGSGKVRWIADLSQSLSWTVRVADAQGTQVRVWKGFADHLDVEWKGTTVQGKPVAPGTYHVSITARRPAGARARPAKFTIKVTAA